MCEVLCGLGDCGFLNEALRKGMGTLLIHLKIILWKLKTKWRLQKGIGMELLNKFADKYGRNSFNFQNILDTVNTANFNIDLKDSDVSFKDNKKKNCINRNKANDLRTEYNRKK